MSDISTNRCCLRWSQSHEHDSQLQNDSRLASILASGWVALERSTAVHRDPANAGRRFIPLLLGDGALPDTLRRYKYVDFRGESELAFAEVLATGQAETGAMQRRFSLPHGARRAGLRRRARQSNATIRTQSRTLATLRDTLLPKLQSGAIQPTFQYQPT